MKYIKNEFKVGQYIFITNRDGRIDNNFLENNKIYHITFIEPMNGWNDINCVLNGQYRFRLFDGNKQAFAFCRHLTLEENLKYLSYEIY